MAISTNPKPTIYRNSYDNTGPEPGFSKYLTQMLDISLVQMVASTNDMANM